MVDLCKIVNTLTGCDTPESTVASKDLKARYSRISISLDDELTDQEFYLAGTFIGMASISGGGTCKIRLDHVHAEQINLREVHSIRSHFNKIYITSDGGGGTVILYICQSMETVITGEITTPYTGNVFSYVKNTSNDVQRVSPYSHIYADLLRIRNTEAVNDAEFGTGGVTALPTAAVFRTYSYRLKFEEEMVLNKVDLYELCFCSTLDDAAAHLRMIAVMK